MTPEHKQLAKRFVEYISDDLPPEIEMPTMLDMGNALLDAHAEIAVLQAAMGKCKVLAVSAMTGDVDEGEALSEINNLIVDAART